MSEKDQNDLRAEEFERCSTWNNAEQARKMAVAVAEWIRVSYYVTSQHLLGWTHETCVMHQIEAEERLREVLTGQKDLVQAALKLGCKADPRREAVGKRRERGSLDDESARKPLKRGTLWD